MKVKNFQDRLNEASLRGNPGIPGEGGTVGNYLNSLDARARQRNEQFARQHGQDIDRFMAFVQRAHILQANHKPQLEKLAEDAIQSLYGSILDGVKLNIKFPKDKEIQDKMEKVKPEPPQQMKELEDAGIISEIQRRKIANNITQGEAKNTKLCLNLPEVRDGIVRILGREEGTEYLECLNKITEIAGFFDWQIPLEIQLEMWERDKSGFSGAVSVDWEKPKKEEKPEKEETAEELAQRILKDLEKGPDIDKDDLENLFGETVPTINALGTDFAMLLHETVKGVYELIAACAIPDDEETSEIIISNTDTLSDELEDLRYGPEIAGDLRDFINTFPESDSIENLRERFFGKLMLLPADQFLSLMLKILSQDPSAKREAKEIIKEIQDELSDYDAQMRDYDAKMAGIDSDDYDEENPEEYDDEESDVLEPEDDKEDNKEEEPGDEDYSQMSQTEIQRLIDDALDSKDYDKARELSQYLKESRRYDLYQKLKALND